MFLAKVVPEFVEIVFRIFSIGDILQEYSRSAQVGYHGLECHVKKVQHPVQLLDHVLVEHFAVSAGTLEHSADGFA